MAIPAATPLPLTIDLSQPVFGFFGYRDVLCFAVVGFGWQRSKQQALARGKMGVLRVL